MRMNGLKPNPARAVVAGSMSVAAVPTSPGAHGGSSVVPISSNYCCGVCCACLLWSCCASLKSRTVRVAYSGRSCCCGPARIISSSAWPTCRSAVRPSRRGCGCCSSAVWPTRRGSCGSAVWPSTRGCGSSAVWPTRRGCCSVCSPATGSPSRCTSCHQRASMSPPPSHSEHGAICSVPLFH